MAVKSKTGTARIEHQPGPPKTTRQGYGQQSRPRRRGRKPQSLKDQSIALLNLIQGNKKAWQLEDLDVVRRALEQLPDHE
jgi:hypothetical protein